MTPPRSDAGVDESSRATRATGSTTTPAGTHEGGAHPSSHTPGPTHRTSAESRADHLALLEQRADAAREFERHAQLAAVIAALGKLGEARPAPDPNLLARVRVLSVVAFVAGAGLSVQGMLWDEPGAIRLLGGVSNVPLLAATVAAAITTGMTHRRLWTSIASGWALVWAVSVTWLSVKNGLGWQGLGSPLMALSLLAAVVALLGAAVQAHVVRAEADRRRINRKIAAATASLTARHAALRRALDPGFDPTVQSPSHAEANP